MSKAARAWPVELAFDRDGRKLEIKFDDDAAFAIPFELLRVESPSAEARGHGRGPRKLILGKGHVGIVDAQPVGRYAVRIIFDDGHDSGLYSWDYLYELGRDADARMQSYRARVEASETHPEA